MDATLSIIILLVMVLGAVQVALTLYARNVVAAAAHEGARAAIELGRNPHDALVVARSSVERSAGGLVDRMRVTMSLDSTGARSVVQVRVTGLLNSPGPVPLKFPVSSVATSSRQKAPE